MSTIDPPSRPSSFSGYHRRKRAKNKTRSRSLPRTVSAQDDNLTERKRIERMWEQSINFFEGGESDRRDNDKIDIKGERDGKA